MTRVNYEYRVAGELSLERRDVVADILEHFHKHIALGVANSVEYLRVYLVAQKPDPIENRPCLESQKEVPSTAVGEVGPTLYQAIGLHPVVDTHHGHGVHFCQLGQAGLAHTLVSFQANECLRLRQVETDLARALSRTDVSTGC